LVVRGQVYYIKKKHKRAKVPFHTVKDGETLWEVSQNYGITMKSLLKKNRMEKPEILKAGRILWLRRTRPEKTPIEYEEVPPAPPVIPLPKKPTTDSAQASKPATYTQPKAKVVPSTPAKIEFTLPEDSIRAAREAAVSDSILKADDIREQQEENSADSVQIFVAGGHKKKTEQKPETTETKPVEKPRANENTATNATPPVKSTPTSTLPFKEHKVSAGQTLFKIAKIYGVRIDSLVAWNNLDGSPLKLGQPVLVRTDKDIVVETPQPPAPRVDTTVVAPKTEIKPAVVETPKTTTPAATTTTEYIVKSGDTLFKIARENGVTVQQLKEWNNKTDFNVALGEKIVLKK
jgi:membrane-bound lytic murein transglycosylase D